MSMHIAKLFLPIYQVSCVYGGGLVSEIRFFNRKMNNSENGHFLVDTFPMVKISPFLNQT